MKVDFFAIGKQGSRTETPRRHGSNPESQTLGEDRWEPSGSCWAQVGLAGAGLGILCASLTQPVLAAPRDVPRFQPPQDTPGVLQPEPEAGPAAVGLGISADNLWNLAPSNLQFSESYSRGQEIVPAFPLPDLDFSFPSDPKAETSEPSPPRVKVQPLAQSNSISCGQTSVAMAVNAIRGSRLRDVNISYRYGFSLLGALNAESRSAGVAWRDAGNLSPSKWTVIERALEQGLPVIVGLNGPQFSPSGRGHIVTIVGVDGDKVEFADPAHGIIRETTKEAMNRAPSYPKGSFIFLPFRFRF